MNKLSALLAAACLMGSVSLSQPIKAFGQAQQQPAAAAAQDKPDAAAERKAYDALNACIAEKDCNKKLTMAREAIGLYPKSQYVPYMKDQITQARGCLLQEALKNEKWGDAMKVGDEVLTEDPDNLNYVLTLADMTGRLGKKGDYSLADKGTAYAKKAVQLIDAGKEPAGLSKEEWLKRKPLVLASMHQSIGLFALKAKKDDEAFTELNLSVKDDCSDPVTHYLIAQIHNNKYVALGDEFRGLSAEDQAGDKGKAVLEKINSVVDQMLEAYAKMMVVAEGKANYDGLRNKVKPAMEELFKYRHEGNADGMQAYIDGFKTACATSAQ